MNDFITAQQARELTKTTMLSIMLHIKEQALKGYSHLILPEGISESAIKMLKDYGYEVAVEEIPMYQTDHYGHITDTNYYTQTSITW